MNTHTLLSLLFFLALGANEVAAKVRFGLHFDEYGNVVKPDQEFLVRGLDDDEQGFRQSALNNFKKSAWFGNHYAMSLVGLYHLQDEAYVKSLAWFKIIDLSAVSNKQYIEDMIFKLENYLKKDELDEVKELNAELSEVYSDYQTLLNREKWRKNIRVTGTRIRGHIPSGLTFLTDGGAVTGFNVRNQIEEFVYEYDFNFSGGDVKLNEVELIDATTKDSGK